MPTIDPRRGDLVARMKLDAHSKRQRKRDEHQPCACFLLVYNKELLMSDFFI